MRVISALSLMAVFPLALVAQRGAPPRPTPPILIPQGQYPYNYPTPYGQSPNYIWGSVNRQPILTVVGHASFDPATSPGTLRLRVSATGRTSQSASQALTRKTDAIKSALEDAGIRSLDITGSRYRLVGTTATRELVLTLTATQADRASEAATGAGATEVSDFEPTSTLTDRERTVLTRRAIIDARRTAESLCDEAGIELLGLIDSYPDTESSGIALVTRWRVSSAPDQNDYPDYPIDNAQWSSPGYRTNYWQQYGPSSHSYHPRDNSTGNKDVDMLNRVRRAQAQTDALRHAAQRDTSDVLSGGYGRVHP